MASNRLKADNANKVAVIGAGPAGMTAAYKLAKGGISVDVQDAFDSVGGMAWSLIFSGNC